MQNRTIKFAEILSLTTLAAASVLALPLTERLVAAAWQSYKFARYANDGHINLSFKTGLVFSVLLAVTFAAAFSANILAKRYGATRALAWSSCAMFVVVAAAASYWQLGISALNPWR